MDEFKDKQKRQRVIVVEKYLYQDYDWTIDKIFTNVTKCYNLHFKAFFWNHESLKEFKYQSFIKAIKSHEGIFENRNFEGFYGESQIRFRYTIHQLE